MVHEARTARHLGVSQDHHSPDEQVPVALNETEHLPFHLFLQHLHQGTRTPNPGGSCTLAQPYWTAPGARHHQYSGLLPGETPWSQVNPGGHRLFHQVCGCLPHLPHAQTGTYLRCRCLGEWLIHQVRTPTYLHSDQFESQTFQGVCQLLDIKKTSTKPSTPTATARVRGVSRCSRIC